ncbi:MAG TPA: sensor histidine kinase [Natronosporangium sp.]
MSEQPTRAGTAQPRRRRVLGRLQDLPIWLKLGVIMVIPTLATLVVGTNAVIGDLETLSNADRARDLAELSQESGELVHRLQDERAAAVLLLGARTDAERDERTLRFNESQQAVDEARNAYQDRRNVLADLPPGFRALLNDVGGRLSSLPQIRSRIAAGEFGISDTAASYEELISGLITIRESSAQLAGEVTLGDRMRAAAAIARSKEYLSRQRVIGHEVLIRGAYPPHLRAAFIGSEAGRVQAEEQFTAVATPAEQTMLEQALDGPDVRQSTLYQDYLDSLEGEDLGNPPWDAASWDQVMSAHGELLRELERQLDRDVVALAAKLSNDATNQILLEGAGLLVMLGLAVFLASLVARSMARSLRELRQGALAVAQYGLPQAVARLRDPSLATQLSPAKLAEQIAQPLPVRGRDEFGQVTEAFNAVHLEAVRTAAEQAALRASVSQMFVNLARRSQLLVDRLIGHLDRLERGEEDPDRLAELFQLDHLATRMRRNDENLLVLAGADSTRVQRRPAPLMDVLRAAQSEVEHYTRIEFGVVDRDIEVAAHAVNDVVHLLAELFDNATAFSPPDTQVTVEARRVGDRAVLYIEDQGLGMSAEQLAEINQRLATPPLVDVGVSRMMGLVVVSRLAARHGIRVELRRGAERGTVADVTLPPQVLVSRPVSGQQFPLTELARQPSGSPRSRTPLALESGPAAGDRRQAQAAAVTSSPPAATPTPAAPGAPRLPSWSDLTGATGSNGAGTGGTGPTTVAAGGTTGGTGASVGERAPGNPLPRRRPGATRVGASSLSADLSMIPHSRPTQEASTAPAGAAPAATDGGGRPDDGPPAWPPLAPPATTPASPSPAPSQEPDRAPAAGVNGAVAADRTPSPAGSDETVELPIYREVESVWFRAKRKPPADSGADTPQAQRYATVGAGAADASAGAAAASGTEAPSAGGSDWRTAADEGWRAASSLSQARVDGVTASGLPKRRPMAQLVPGGVESAQVTPQRRSPEAVRGLLSAYHRGVQRGRMHSDGGRGSAQDGKEQGR